jgi:MFS transporter, putative metabolite:H+ symporter
MYVQARDMHYKLAGMSMDPEMVIGMIAIVLGLVLAGYGLLPRSAHYDRAARLRVRTLDEARMTPLHVGLLVQPAIS